MSMRLKGIVLAQAPESLEARVDLPAQRPVANRPIICHVIDALRSAGADDIAVIGNPASLQRLRSPAQSPLPDVRYITSRSNEDVLGLIADAAPFVGDDPCMVHVADGLAGEPLRPPALDDTGPDVSLFVHHSQAQEPELDAELGELLGLASLDRGRSGLGIAGVGFLGPRALANVCPGAPDRLHSLTALAERIAACGGRLHVGRVSMWRRYNGDPNDLLAINHMILDRLTGADVGEPRYPDSRIEGRVDIHPTATVTDSVISGPAIIGPGAQITGSYVGPYTSIGANVVIRAAEIESSIVSDGAVVKHVTDRIERSTVGPNAVVSREFSLPRGIRMHLGEGAELILD
jgi:glucose-1-phosphate thymidylyltransferase